MSHEPDDRKSALELPRLVNRDSLNHIPGKRIQPGSRDPRVLKYSGVPQNL
jgi:hypothetical protein